MSGQINVKGVLELDGSGWDATLRKASRSVDHLTNEGLSELKGIIAGAFTVGAVESFIHSTIEAVAQIKDFSEQSGLTTDEVQKLQIAAEKTGLSFEDFQTALSKLGKARKEAAEGNNELRITLAKYGATLESLNNPMLTNLGLLDEMKERIASLSKTAAGREELKEFFGRGGDKLAVAIETYAHLPKDVTLIKEKELENIDQVEKKLKGIERTLKAIVANGPVGNIASVLSGESSWQERLMSALTLMRDLNPSTLVANKIDDYVNSSSGGVSNPRSAFGFIGQTAMESVHTADMFSKGPMFHDNLADEEQKKVDESQEKLSEAQHKLAYESLNDADKKIELQKEINQLLIDENAIRASGTPEAIVEANNLKTKATNLATELQSLSRKGDGIHGNSLMSVGNFLGVGRNNITTAADRTNELLFQLLGESKGLRQDLKNGGTLGVPPS
jgi:hypothetical protein